MMPSAGPKSQCGLGVNSNLRGSPIVRMTRFSFSSTPYGTRASRMFGSEAVSAFNSISTSATCLSNSAILSPTTRIASIFDCRAVASFICPISFETTFRSALSTSTCESRARRLSSNCRIESTADVSIWRSFNALRTTSGVSRIRLISNMLHLQVHLIEYAPVHCRTRGVSWCHLLLLLFKYLCTQQP